MKTHVYNKHDEKTEDFLCDSCEYKANTKRKLKRHVENSHTSTNVKTFHCNDCNSNFRNLKQHIINVHGEKIHKCDQCDYIGKSRKYLSEHVVGVHGEKTIMCNMCDYKAKYKATLSIHIENVHLNLRKKCLFCGKEMRKTEIQKHVRLFHSNEEKTLQCSMCDIKFLIQRDLNAHFKRTHEKEVQTFECHTCTFKTESRKRGYTGQRRAILLAIRCL